MKTVERIAAYCRVSTDKRDQLNSLESQREFFKQYIEHTDGELYKLYADEGISGTSLRRRIEFQRMMVDAEMGKFDKLVVKDVSRFARNTVDLLQNIRKLKSLGIETLFITANMKTVAGDSEFILTMFGALAQEESANMSKRVKFGKRINAEKGRVPNICYGYDKIPDDMFNLKINEVEAEIVKEIFRLYTDEGFGGTKIAQILNAKGLKTKRGCAWSGEAVRRLLEHDIYTGKIIHGKQEVSDFLTGTRKDMPEDNWVITVREDLRIVSDELFQKAKVKKQKNSEAIPAKFKGSTKHPFSSLIKCKDCGWSFKRIYKKYTNEYIRWVCSQRNLKGLDSCPNAIKIDEGELIRVLQSYFNYLLANKKGIMEKAIADFESIYKSKSENLALEQSLFERLSKLKKARQKYMDMYTDEIITREELNEKTAEFKEEISDIEVKLRFLSYSVDSYEHFRTILRNTFKEIEDITDVSQMTNGQLKRIIEKIEVDHDGNVEIFLKALGSVGEECRVSIYNDGEFIEHIQNDTSVHIDVAKWTGYFVLF